MRRYQDKAIRTHAAAVVDWYARADVAASAGMGDFAAHYRNKARAAAAEVARLVKDGAREKERV